METIALKLLDAVASISAQGNPYDAACETAKSFIEVIGGDLCVLFKWDPEKETMNLWADFCENRNKFSASPYLSYPISGFPEAAKAVNSKSPTQIQISNHQIDENERLKLKKMGAKSLLIQPLVAQNDLIGFIELYNIDEEQEYNPNDLIRTGALAYHASIALQRAILLEEITQQAKELEIVRQVSLSLTANLDAQEILYTILDSALKLSRDALDTHIFLYKNNTLTFGAALWADGKRGEPFAEPRKEGATYIVAQTGEMLVATDLQKHERFEGMGWTGALISLPLKSGDQVVGVMNIAYKNPRPFTENDLRVIQLLADHAGIALERAVLLEEAEKRAAELEAVRQASLSLNSSLELQDVLQAILEGAMGLSKDAQNANLFLYQDNTLFFQAALWADGRKETQRPFSEPRKDGLTYTVARSGELIAVEDMQDHELFKKTVMKKGWKGAIIGLPLKTGGEVVGVMNVAYQNPRTFSENDLRALQLLADHAAIAVDNARLHNLVSYQAATDALTNLANRRAFDQKIEQEIQRANRYEHNFSLIMIDLNDFKKVNDTYGHLAGDHTLHEIATRLKESVRETDFIARIGGDEMAVILPETTKKEAAKIGEKLSKAISGKDFTWKETDSSFSVSLEFGVSQFPNDGEDPKSLMQAADAAMYKEK